MLKRFGLVVGVLAMFLCLATPASAVTPFTISSEACPAAGTCYAAGPAGLRVTTDGAQSWHSVALPLGVSGLSAITCVSTTSCVAAGGSRVLRTTNGGASWTIQTIPQTSGPGPIFTGLTTISCRTVTFCAAFGADNMGGSASYISHGGSWSISRTGTGSFSSVSCPSATTCFAAGSKPAGSDFSGAITATTDAGASWHDVKYYPGPNLDNAAASATEYSYGPITCSGMTCLATGSYAGMGEGNFVSITTNGGTTWRDLTNIPSGFITNGIRCSTPSTCFMDNGSRIIRTTNYGYTWTNVHVPSGVSDLTNLACGAPQTCYAYGHTSYLVTTDDGLTWTSRTHP